ncbi:anthrax toxin-like adenylyl cyclase domain-containing protein [Proteus vulgaris]|uniref:anthrax toxin-like adenylyl cyclase domain-containing protein n=1 Tax=Proteus vulgaris TaxID=585 RepID=UPI001E4EC369
MFIEGIAQKLNVPIYTINNSEIKLSTTKNINYSYDYKKEAIVNEFTIEKNSEIIKSNSNYNSIHLFNNVYKKLSFLYPDFRKKTEFLIGYKDNIMNVIHDYSENMTIKDIFEYIEKNRYRLTMKELGAIVREIDNKILETEINKKQKKKFIRLFNKIKNEGNIDKEAYVISFPQQMILSKLKDGGEGYCESLSMLIAAAKHLEHHGEYRQGSRFLKKLDNILKILDKNKVDEKVPFSELSLNYSAKKLLLTIEELSQKQVSLSSLAAHFQHDKAELTLNAILNRLLKAENTVKPLYFQLYTKKHTLLVWANKTSIISNFGFYDPNFGLVEFSSEEKFRSYLISFFKGKDINAEKIYQLDKSQSGDIIFDKVITVNTESLIRYQFKNNQKLSSFILEPIVLFNNELQYNELSENNEIYKNHTGDLESKRQNIFNITYNDIRGCYIFSDNNYLTRRKTVLLFSNDKYANIDINNYQIEYQKAGYDIFIFDSSTENLDKAYHYLNSVRGISGNDILIHASNDDSKRAIDLYYHLKKKGKAIEGIVLTSSNNKTISVLDNFNKLDENIKIYISFDNDRYDDNNLLIKRKIEKSGTEVKIFSFSYREEYKSFHDVKANQHPSIRKFSNYKSRDLLLVPIDNLELLPLIGMPENDQRVFSQIAESENVIIGVRPVDTNSTTLISSKEYSSKSLLIKGKSSDWGPMAGFIPIDQRLAKASARKEAEKYNLLIQGSLEKNYAIKVPLTLSLERVDELIVKGVLIVLEEKGDILKVSALLDDIQYEFSLSQFVEGDRKYYTVNQYQENSLIPVEVLADPISRKPIIADYDLFTVMYPYSELGSETKVRQPMPWEEWKESVIYDELSEKNKEYYNSQDLYDRYIGGQLGFISEKVNKIKNRINADLGRGKGYEIVHHGADDANPYAVIHDNFPATFFVPEKIRNKILSNDENRLKNYFHINDNYTIIIRDAKEFSNFQQLMINHSFRTILNERWNDGLESSYFSKERKISHRFILTKERVEKELRNREENEYIKLLKKRTIDINEKYSNIPIDNKKKYYKSLYYDKAIEEIEKLKNIKNKIKTNELHINEILSISTTLKNKIRKNKIDLNWFKTEGYEIFNSILLSDDYRIIINRENASRLSNVFEIISLLPEVKKSIYKSITVDSIDNYINKIKIGSKIAINENLITQKNSNELKINTDNVFISIIGEHNGRNLSHLYEEYKNNILIAPGKHFNVVKQEKINENLFMVLEATNFLEKNDITYDLRTGKENGISIDGNRSTVNEILESKVANEKIIDSINKIKNQYIQHPIKNNIIDKIINNKISLQYAIHKYFNDLSILLSSNSYKEIKHKLNSVIYDPLIGRKFNHYVGGEIDIDEFNKVFQSKFYSNISILEKIQHIKILVNAIYDTPYNINLLSFSSQELLSELFISKYGNANAQLLRKVSSLESYSRIINTIENMEFYLSNRKENEVYSINDIFHHVSELEWLKEKMKNTVQLLRNKLLSSGSYNHSHQIDFFNLPHSFYTSITEGISSLMLLYSTNNKNNDELKIKDFSLFESLYKKKIKNKLNEDEKIYLSKFEELVEVLSIKDTIDDSVIFLKYGNLESNINILSNGVYIIDFHDNKMSLNINSKNKDEITYDFFIDKIGSVKITGKERNKLTTEFLSFLNGIFSGEDNILKVVGSESNLNGSIYKVDMSYEKNSIDLLKQLVLHEEKLLSYKLKKSQVRIHDIVVDRKLLSSLGCRIDGKDIESVKLKDIPKWKHKLTFDADKLNDFFLSASGNDNDNNVILVLKKLLNKKESNIKKLLSIDINRTDYLAAKERLTKLLELNKAVIDSSYWNALRYPSLSLPRHMKIISNIGYGNIAFGIWQSFNSTMNMLELLKNEHLSETERKEITTNLAIMWTEMSYNGVSELIEIAVAKGMLKHRSNAFEYAGKISTRVGVALNILSVGFDIYNAYDNFSRISSESDSRKREDYIVNGSIAIVSALVTIGVSIAILAGSTVAGPIGIVVGAAIALVTSIYNAVRVVEQAKEKISFTVWEEIESGFLAAFTGKIAPYKQNEITLNETKEHIKATTENISQEYYQQLIKINPNSKYFYTNEEYHYEDKNYYQVEPTILQDPTGLLGNGIGKVIASNLLPFMTQKEVEAFYSRSTDFVAIKTQFKYYEPKEAIGTDEILIFDGEFYVNSLKKYTIDIVQNNNNLELDIYDDNYIESIQLTLSKIEPLKKKVSNDITCVNKIHTYFDYQLKENEEFHFNTKNGDDIIAAPANTKNYFDIYNGTKRLSGGVKDDIFNLYTTKVPKFASRFYGREGNDTLRIAEKSPEHSGYEINLQSNYVKFSHIKEPSNGLNFKEKNYFHQDVKSGNKVPKVLVDTMPNIKVQDHEVIAYLDNIENIIGSKNGNDLLVGNDNNNYIDGVSGSDMICGHQGDDVIRLMAGVAEGGKGNDIYIISRMADSEIEKSFTSIILYEQEEKETSIVRLKYNFNEIKTIKRDRLDIILELENTINKNSNKLKIPSTYLRLKNIYKNIDESHINHQYSIITDDGFIFTLNDNPALQDEALFIFSYFEHYSTRKDKIDYFSIDEQERLLTVRFGNDNEKYTLNSKLKYSGIAVGNLLEFGLTGNKGNNTYFSITPNSFINLSNGHDTYQLKSFIASERDDSISILPGISGIEPKLKSTATIILPDVSGYDLKLEKGILMHRYNVKKHLTLDIGEYYLAEILKADIEIRILDKEGKVFRFPHFQSENILLEPVIKTKIEITDGHDSVIIPEAIRLNKFTAKEWDLSLSIGHNSLLANALKSSTIPELDLLPVIDMLEGNDLIINNNAGSSIISGGGGDDTLIVTKGHHILLAEEGNDSLYGGDGNDVLISDKGNDYLEGGVGNDIYIINRHKGEVTVFDSQGDNKLFIIGLKQAETLLSSRENSDELLKTEDSEFTLRIKDRYQAEKSHHEIIQVEAELSDIGLNTIIHEMAQFNANQLASMNGSQLPPSLDWSLLPVVVNQLK